MDPRHAAVNGRAKGGVGARSSAPQWAHRPTVENLVPTSELRVVLRLDSARAALTRALLIETCDGKRLRCAAAPTAMGQVQRGGYRELAGPRAGGLEGRSSTAREKRV